MAYNNGFPIGYQPYPQTYAQQYQQSQQYQNQQAQPTPNLIWVQGETAAKSYPIAPNSSVPLWDSEANVIYIKSADMSGMPSMRIIDYTIRDNAPQKPSDAQQSTFATKDEVESIKEEISALKSKLERFSYEGGGSSYARGRGRNARRDSMGRYSSAGNEMLEELRDLMHDAPDEQTRMEFERFISKIEQMQ